jgi:hypothetical protein
MKALRVTGCTGFSSTPPIVEPIWKVPPVTVTRSIDVELTDIITVTLNCFVSIVLPLVIVAVSVTFVVTVGLVTKPALLTMLVLLESQVIDVPLGPVVARPIFCVMLEAESPAA